MHLALYRKLTDQSPLDDEKAFDTEDARRYKRYRVMRAMGWNWTEYRGSPHSLIDEIYLFIQTEERAQADVIKDKRNNG